MSEEFKDEMITIDELCRILSVGRNTAYGLLKSGEIRGAFRMGRIWKIPRGAVSEYVGRKMQMQK